MTQTPRSASWDVLHHPARPGDHYCTGNIGEAIPGIQTPLSWTVWGPTIERAARRTFHAVGAFTRAERAEPADPTLRINQVFHGRSAFRLEGLAALGDRLPGTTGAEVIAGMCGEAPSGIVYSPTRRRYPLIAVGMPRQMLRVRQHLPTTIVRTDRWYHETIPRISDLDLAATQGLLRDAADRFFDTVAWQMTALCCVIQPLYDTITRVSARTGVGDPLVLSAGYGGVPETMLVTDLWDASRGRLGLDEVARRHGFHGPLEGELSARVWREDDSPLKHLLGHYAEHDDDRDPRLGDGQRRAARIAMERAVVAAAPRPARPVLRGLFRTASTMIPLRGSAKNAFLQAFDVLRAGARHSGVLLAERGVLDAPDDVFFLTFDELLAGAVSREIVELRKDRNLGYQQVRLPESWTGEPVPLPVTSEVRPQRRRVTGTGVSAGIVEGRVRVVEDPTFTDVLSGEILVAATTDPSWSSIMFVSAALVVDIGGVMSHAAVVARDLGIPCVVNTGNGSRALRTGDLVRVDGTTGVVEILTPV